MSVVLKPAMKRWLVTEAERIVERTRSTKRDQVSQLRNMLQISQRESEVPVLVNFLRYQVGRKATQQFWEPIFDQVEKALKQIEERCKKEHGEEEQQTRSLAIQHFFGFMVRHYVYLRVQNKRRQGGREYDPRGREQQRR